MSDPRAIEYIKQQRAFGIGDENIKTNAIRGGFTDQEVNEALAALGPYQRPQATTTPNMPSGFAVTPPVSIISSTPRVSPAVPFVYAGFWRRFVAILLDGLLLTIILTIFSLILAIFVQKDTVTPTTAGPFTTIFAWAFAICTFFYYPLLE